MSVSKLINLSNVQQLIDLNQDLTNFKLEFTIVSENNTPFNAVVTSQAKLDSGEVLEFKNVENGSISGNIIADNGVKQNYYLVLKSEMPTKCKLEINIEEIPMNEKHNQQQEMKNNSEFERYMHAHGGKSVETTFFSSKTFLFLSILVGGLVMYYLFYGKQNNTNASISNETIPQDDIISSIPSIEPVIEPSVIPSVTPSVIPSVIPSVTPSVTASADTIFGDRNSRLLSKINDIKFY